MPKGILDLLEGDHIGRPRKNRDNLVGRAGRNAIQREDLERVYQRGARRQAIRAKYSD